MFSATKQNNPFCRFPSQEIPHGLFRFFTFDEISWEFRSFRSLKLIVLLVGPPCAGEDLIGQFSFFTLIKRSIFSVVSCQNQTFFKDTKSGDDEYKETTQKEMEVHEDRLTGKENGD